MKVKTSATVRTGQQLRVQSIENELNQAFRGNTYKMSTVSKKRSDKRRTKTLDEECLGACTIKSTMKIPEVAMKSAHTKNPLNRKSPKERSSKVRRRKTADEINLLEKAFSKDPEWTQETVDFIKDNSNLEYVQIYKWGWDQKKKVKKNPNLKRVPTIDEFGGYCKYDNSDAHLLAL